MTTKSVTERPDYPNGCCPVCAATGEYRGEEQLLWLNVGRIDYLVCDRHSVYWKVGENSGSENWRLQSAEERERNAARIATMRRVEPFFLPLDALRASNYHPVLDTMAISIDGHLEDNGSYDYSTQVLAVQRPAHEQPLVNIEVCCPRTTAGRELVRLALQGAIEKLDDSFRHYEAALTHYDSAAERLADLHERLPIKGKRELLCQAMDLAERCEIEQLDALPF